MIGLSLSNWFGKKEGLYYVLFFVGSLGDGRGLVYDIRGGDGEQFLGIFRRCGVWASYLYQIQQFLGILLEGGGVWAFMFIPNSIHICTHYGFLLKVGV